MDNVLGFAGFAFANANFPAVILCILLLVLFAVAMRAQAQADFNWADIFKDESGKPSSSRFIMLLATFISTWIMIYFAITVVKTADDLDHFANYLIGYLLVTTFPKYAEKLIDTVIAKFGK